MDEPRVRQGAADDVGECDGRAGDLSYAELSCRTITLLLYKRKRTVATPSPWPGKVIAVLKAGNSSAAIAQIKVAPSVRDLRALEKALAAAQLKGKWKDVDIAIEESLQALSAPRLHRSP